MNVEEYIVIFKVVEPGKKLGSVSGMQPLLYIH